MTSDGNIIVHKTNPPTAPATIVLKNPMSSFDWPGFANNSLVPKIQNKNKISFKYHVSCIMAGRTLNTILNFPSDFESLRVNCETLRRTWSYQSRNYFFFRNSTKCELSYQLSLCYSQYIFVIYFVINTLFHSSIVLHPLQHDGGRQLFTYFLTLVMSKNAALSFTTQHAVPKLL